MATLDDLNISESNINDMVIVKDQAGNEYVCNIRDLKSAKGLSDDERNQCVQNVEDAAKK